MATALAGGVADGSATAAGVYSAVGAFGAASTGTAVLGGLVAFPALAITGLLLGSKADEALSTAKTNKKEADKYEQDAKNLCTAMEAIGARAEQITALLNDLDYAFRPLVSGMISTINKRGVDWRNYSRDEQTVIGMALNLPRPAKSLSTRRLSPKTAS